MYSSTVWSDCEPGLNWMVRRTDSREAQHWGLGVSQLEQRVDPKDLGRLSGEMAGRELTTHGSCNAGEDGVDEKGDGDIVGEREGLVSRIVLDIQAERDCGEDSDEEEDGDWSG